MAKRRKKRVKKAVRLLAGTSPHDWNMLRVRLTPDEWAHVYRKLTKRALKSGEPPWHALNYWVRAAAEDAEDYLHKLDFTERDERTLLSFVAPLTWIGSPAAIGMLREIRNLRRESPAAQSAQLALEALGAEPADRIEALAAEWRETGRYEPLARLYHDYIERLPEGHPFGQWAIRLGHTGPPLRSDCYCFSAKDPSAASLFVEVDAEGGMRGWSLKS